MATEITRAIEWRKDFSRGLPQILRKDETYSSNDFIDRHYIDITKFNREKELLRIPKFPGNRGMSPIVKQEDGYRCMIVKQLNNDVVKVDSKLSLMCSPDDNSPVSLMDTFFYEGKPTCLNGSLNMPGSVKLGKFPTGRIENLSELFKDVFNRYILGCSFSQRFSFKDLQGNVRDYKLPDTHQNSVKSLLEI